MFAEKLQSQDTELKEERLAWWFYPIEWLFQMGVTAPYRLWLKWEDRRLKRRD